MTRPKAALVLLALALVSRVTPAVEYSFTPIDALQGANSGFGNAAINDSGAVAYFRATPGSAPDFGVNGVYLAQGGQIRPIIERPGFQNVPLGLALNDQAQVLAHFAHGPTEALYLGAVGSPPPVTTVADTAGPFSRFGFYLHTPILDPSGRPVFNATLDDGTDGIFTGGDPVADRFVGGFPSLVHVREDGTIIYRDAGRGFDFYKGPNPTDLVFDPGPAFDAPTQYEENAAGNRIFVTRLKAPADQSLGIFTGADPVGDRFADTSGAYHSFRVTELNDRGTIAFLAELDDDTPTNGGDNPRGIFVGPDPVADKVIAVGDPLFGSTATSINLIDGALNDRDQVAFTYRLANGESGVAVVTVPEPAAAVLAFSAMALFWSRRQR